MKFTLTLTQDDVAKEQQKVTNKALAHVTLKGFRKGKAPRELALQHLDGAKIAEEAINNLIPQAYSAYVTEHKLKPITQPKIELTSADQEKDWEFSVEIAEKPEVDLGQYKKALKALKPKKPGSADAKAGKDDEKAQAQLREAKNEHLNTILDTLKKSATLTVPPLLVEEEVSAQLSRLQEQVVRMGLTMESYLASMKKTEKEVRKEYAAVAEQNLALDFIFGAIAEQEKLMATQKDLTDFLEKITDPEAKKYVQSSYDQQVSILSTMTRQRVMEHLNTLSPYPEK